MDNPAVHNLDDVRLRAEDGQIVLEVAGQTVPVDVDIDGSLSLDEIEAFTDNSIDAKGSDLENLGSVSTDELRSPEAPRVVEKFDLSGTNLEVELPEAPTVEILINHISTENNNRQLRAQFGQDGGDTFFDNDDYEWVIRQFASDGSDLSDNNSDDDSMALLNGLSTFGTRSRVPIRLQISDPLIARPTNISCKGTPLATRTVVMSGGFFTENESTDMIRFFTDENDEIDAFEGQVVAYPGVVE